MSCVFPFFHSPQFTPASNRRAITTPLTAVSESSIAAGAPHLFYRMTKSCLFHTRPFTSVIRVPAPFHTQAPMTATSPAGPTDSPTCHKTPIGRSPHCPACIWHVYGVTQRRVQCLFPGAWRCKRVRRILRAQERLMSLGVGVVLANIQGMS